MFPCRFSQDYMSGQHCDSTVLLGGAVVYSHYMNQSRLYRDEVDCEIRFKSKNSNWKIMLRMLEMDIPDRQDNGICNDALYVSDSDKIYDLMNEAGGNYGLCGNKLPSTIYSSGRFLTVHFSTETIRQSIVPSIDDKTMERSISQRCE
ncbi:hypothetical protein ACF0H5_006709 [Mactra antiquata]